MKEYNNRPVIHCSITLKIIWYYGHGTLSAINQAVDPGIEGIDLKCGTDMAGGQDTLFTLLYSSPAVLLTPISIRVWFTS